MTEKIRSLTPRECFRLMGQDEEDIDKIYNTNLSKTSLYRLAGNSIVVDVLSAIFQGIYIDETFEEPKPKQKSLDNF